MYTHPLPLTEGDLPQQIVFIPSEIKPRKVGSGKKVRYGYQITGRVAEDNLKSQRMEFTWFPGQPGGPNKTISFEGDIAEKKREARLLEDGFNSESIGNYLKALVNSL
jgi:hypothetical protein